MAIDYGDARTGVAVSDESASLTGDTWVVHSRRETDTVSAIINEAVIRGVSRIVVGLPKNMDGSIGTRAEKCTHFADLLRTSIKQMQSPSGSLEIEVELMDERLTTMSAHRILNEVGKFGKKRKKTVDAVAASLILEDYLRSSKLSSKL